MARGGGSLEAKSRGGGAEVHENPTRCVCSMLSGSESAINILAVPDSLRKTSQITVSAYENRAINRETKIK